MAKAQGKKTTKRSRKGAPPRTNDAERLAALRWLAMKIEQISIEIFVTNRNKFRAVEDALRAEVTLLQQIGRPWKPLDSDDCPGGYILCPDGLCAPMCDDPPPPGLSARRKTRRPRRR